MDPPRATVVSWSSCPSFAPIEPDASLTLTLSGVIATVDTDFGSSRSTIPTFNLGFDRSHRRGGLERWDGGRRAVTKQGTTSDTEECTARSYAGP